jgi:hypothetical protein
VLLIFSPIVCSHIIGVENSISHGGGHGFQFADTLLDDASVNEPLTLVDDLVGVKTRWHDGGDDKVLETSSKVLRIHVGRAFEVRERVLVGIVG